MARRAGILVACLACAAAWMAPGVSAARPAISWTKPVTLEGDCHRCLWVLSGMAVDGSSVSVWSQHGGAFARTRTAGGHVGLRQRVVTGPPHRPLSLDAFAEGPDGTTAILWNDRSHLLARVRSSDGMLGPVHTIDADLAGNSANALLFGPDDGRARLLAGEFSDPPKGKVGSYFMQPLDAAAGPGARVVLGEQRPAGAASVAVDAAGDAIVVWEEDPFDFLSGDAEPQVLARTISHDGSVGPLLTISRPGQATVGVLEPLVSIGANGRGHVLWSENLPSSGNAGGGLDLSFETVRVMERSIDVHGTIGAAATAMSRVDTQTLNFGRRPGGAMLSAVSFADGTTLVAWATLPRGQTHSRVWARLIGAAGARPPFPVSPRADVEVSAPSVVDHRDRAVIAWTYGIRGPTRFGPPGLTPGLVYGVQARGISRSGVTGPAVTSVAPQRGVSVFDAFLTADGRARNVLLTWVRFRQREPRRVLAASLRG